MTGHMNVDHDALLLAWHEGGSGDHLDMLISGDMPIADLVRVVKACVDQFNQEVEDELEIGVGRTEPTPLGAAVNLGYVENESALVAMFVRLGELLAQRGVSGRLAPFRQADSPIDDPRTPDLSFDAGLSLAGRLVTSAEYDDRWPRWTWQSNPAALSAVVDHALEWCRVPGGMHYLLSGIVQVQVNADWRRELLEISLRESIFSRLRCVRERAEFRSVRFDGNGHVIYSLGGANVTPEWERCVAELNDVLADLAPNLDYAFARRSDTYNTSWALELTRNWPSGRLSKGIPIGKSRPAEPTHLPDVFGTQLLGPSHPDLPAAASDWRVTAAAPGDRRIVTAPDLAPWFAEPTVQSETVDRTREAFAPLLLTPAIADDLYQRRQQQGSEQ